MRISLLLAMAVGASFIGSNCGGSGVGDPCTPEDEYLTSFSGFSAAEVSVESRSFQCLTRVCLVNHFQGRVSCPYGQVEDPDAEGQGLATCMGTEAHRNDPACLPGGSLHIDSCQVPNRDGARWEDRIAVPVDPQYQERQAKDAVYCSCRCAGADANANYCECPSGFQCEELIEDLGLGKEQLAGSYCVKDGTSFQPNNPPRLDCRAGAANCGNTIGLANALGENEARGRNQPAGSCLPSGALCGKGDTCCSTEQVACIDRNAEDAGAGERNCNGCCTPNNKCDLGQDPLAGCSGGGDSSRQETVHEVNRNPCDEGTRCP